jgi:hypothetical protein
VTSKDRHGCRSRSPWSVASAAGAVTVSIAILVLIGIIRVPITILIAIGALCAGLLGLLLGHVVSVADQIGAAPGRQEQRHESYDGTSHGISPLLRRRLWLAPTVCVLMRGDDDESAREER